jgi:hypothetical protein
MSLESSEGGIDVLTLDVVEFTLLFALPFFFLQPDCSGSNAS